VPEAREPRAEVDGGRRLPHSAPLVDDRDREQPAPSPGREDVSVSLCRLAGMVSNPEDGPSSESLSARVQERVESKDLRGAFRLLLELLVREPFHEEGLPAAAKLASHLGSREDADRFAAVAATKDDPQALYDLGLTLVEQRSPELGARHLARCAQLEPDHPLVRYELGYALFQAGEFARALPHLERTTEDGSLAGPEPFAAGLLRVEAHLFLGDVAAARDAFERLEAQGSGGANEHAD